MYSFSHTRQPICCLSSLDSEKFKISRIISNLTVILASISGNDVSLYQVISKGIIIAYVRTLREMGIFYTSNIRDSEYFCINI